MTESAVESAQLITMGQAALKKGAWQEAHDLLRRALQAGESPDALEGYALACCWLDQIDDMFDCRERAFQRYRERGDPRSAARMATALAVDYADFRGELAVAGGWFQRASSLLESVATCAEHGWLEIWQGIVAAVFEGDLPRARVHQARGLELARSLAIFDMEMMAVTLEGFIMVRDGRVDEGLRRMDEATAAAVAGEMSDLYIVGNACCAVIYACEAVADYDRAVQWCERAKQFCRRWGLASLFAICRSYYATVLIWKGAWDEAEEELRAAARELEASRPANALEALAKLGDLRRRQGRHAEAEELLRRSESHPMSLLGKASLALDKNDPESAIDLVRRFIRRTSEEDRAERVFALEVSVRARVLRGDVEGAQADLQEAASLAKAVGMPGLRASAALGAGQVALAQGDLDRAREGFEDAIDLFEATGNDFDGSRARMDLAVTLSKIGRGDAAMEQANMALENFTRLGAAFHAELARRLVRSGKGERPLQLGDAARLPGLTPRESEVLWLLAEGKTNQDIADELVLSVRTIERHISTIYEKLDLHGKSARAAATAFALNQRVIQRLL